MGLALAILFLVPTHASTRPEDESEPIPARIPERETPVSFITEVIEVLDNKCVGCHNSALAENGLNMEEVPLMLEGGRRGPSIVPGNADQSTLYLMGSHRMEPVMPPIEKANLEPLTPEEVGLIKLWIDQGAVDDTETFGMDEIEEDQVTLGAIPDGVHPVTALDLSAEARFLAFGRAEVVEVVDPRSGIPVIRLGGHRDLIQSIRFSPDGRTLAAGSYRDVTLWNVPQVTPSRPIVVEADSAITAIASGLEPDQLVIADAEGRIQIRNAGDGHVIQTIRSEHAPITALDVGLDGSIAAGSVNGTIQVWDPDAAGDDPPRLTLAGHKGSIRDLAYTCACGLASASDDGTVRLWDFPMTGAPEEPIAATHLLDAHDGPIRALHVDESASLLLTGGEDGTVRRWISRTGEPFEQIIDGSRPVVSLTYDPTQDHILSVTDTVRLHDRETGDQLGAWTDHEAAVKLVAIDVERNRAATGDASGRIKVWDLDNGQGIVVLNHPGANDGSAEAPLMGLTFLGDGRLVSVSEKGDARVWSISGGWSDKGVLGPHVFRVLALDFSPDSKRLAAGSGEPSRSGTIHIWDVEAQRVLHELADFHSDTVFGLRFGPDGSTLASTAADKFVKVVDVETGEEIGSFEGHTHHVLGVDWSEDGLKLVSAGADNVIKLWNLENGEQIRTFRPAGNQITAVRWLDGQGVFGADGDGQVRRWNPDDGKLKRSYDGLADYAYTLAVDPDGRFLIAGDASGRVVIWSLDNNKVIRTLEPPAPQRDAAE